MIEGDSPFKGTATLFIFGTLRLSLFPKVAVPLPRKGTAPLKGLSPCKEH